jgi:hypothetical protein
MGVDFVQDEGRNVAADETHLVRSGREFIHGRPTMNSLMENTYPVFRMYLDLRKQLMEILEDNDLALHPAGANAPLGDLCRELGEVEMGYIDSFRTFKLDLASVASTREGTDSVAELQKWFIDLDEELEAAVSGLTEEDLANQQVDRGGWSVSPAMQLEIYKEALLIFCGKVSVYLKAMGKELPEQWQDWIG